jgi:predicted nucleic acid-binding Zn ribbon protein
MQKITCPLCQKSFIWTDTMDPEGRCPTEDCEWRYNVHEELKKSVSRKLPPADTRPACPNCGAPVTGGLTICDGCGCVVAGSKAYKKQNVFIFVVIILLVLSLIYRFL